jgi:hypothetical protein
MKLHTTNHNLRYADGAVSKVIFNNFLLPQTTVRPSVRPLISLK